MRIVAVDETGAVGSLVAVAVLVTISPETHRTRASTVKLADFPTPSVGNVAVTTCGLFWKLQPVPSALSRLKHVGNVSIT